METATGETTRGQARPAPVVRLAGRISGGTDDRRREDSGLEPSLFQGNHLAEPSGGDAGSDGGCANKYCAPGYFCDPLDGTCRCGDQDCEGECEAGTCSSRPVPPMRAAAFI